MSMFSRSISDGVTFVGWFTPGTPVRKTWIRSSRCTPFAASSESGTSGKTLGYTALNRYGSSGSFTLPRNWASSFGFEALK